MTNSNDRVDWSVPPIRQGEVYFYKLLDSDDGHVGDAHSDIEGNAFIVGHSETGHHHVMERDTVEVYAKPGTEQSAEGMDILYAIVKEPTEVRHLRSFDTHKSVTIPKGIWQSRAQRQRKPEGWKRAID